MNLYFRWKLGLLEGKSVSLVQWKILVKLDHFPRGGVKIKHLWVATTYSKYLKFASFGAVCIVTAMDRSWWRCCSYHEILCLDSCFLRLLKRKVLRCSSLERKKALTLLLEGWFINLVGWTQAHPETYAEKKIDHFSKVKFGWNFLKNPGNLTKHHLGTGRENSSKVIRLPDTNSLHLKMMVSNRNLLVQGNIFRSHVSFRMKHRAIYDWLWMIDFARKFAFHFWSLKRFPFLRPSFREQKKRKLTYPPWN